MHSEMNVMDGVWILLAEASMLSWLEDRPKKRGKLAAAARQSASVCVVARRYMPHRRSIFGVSSNGV